MIEQQEFGIYLSIDNKRKKSNDQNIKEMTNTVGKKQNNKYPNWVRQPKINRPMKKANDKKAVYKIIALQYDNQFRSKQFFDDLMMLFYGH